MTELDQIACLFREHGWLPAPTSHKGPIPSQAAAVGNQGLHTVLTAHPPGQVGLSPALEAAGSGASPANRNPKVECSINLAPSGELAPNSQEAWLG